MCVVIVVSCCFSQLPIYSAYNGYTVQTYTHHIFIPIFRKCCIFYPPLPLIHAVEHHFRSPKTNRKSHPPPNAIRRYEYTYKIHTVEQQASYSLYKYIQRIRIYAYIRTTQCVGPSPLPIFQRKHPKQNSAPIPVYQKASHTKSFSLSLQRKGDTHNLLSTVSRPFSGQSRRK